MPFRRLASRSRATTSSSRRDGTVFPVEISNGVYPVGGRTIIISSVRDISRRVQNEELLQQTMRHNAVILETAIEGFFILDEQGRVTEANAALCRMLRYSIEEIKSRKERAIKEQDFEGAAAMRDKEKQAAQLYKLTENETDLKKIKTALLKACGCSICGIWPASLINVNCERGIEAASFRPSAGEFKPSYSPHTTNVEPVGVRTGAPPATG